jgi:hypothetical protein
LFNIYHTSQSSENDAQEQMLRISNASVHIVPHGSMSHALMFAREVRLFFCFPFDPNPNFSSIC